MSDLPASVHINEEGPREGFQIEKGPIPTARKIALIDALARTGLDHIQIVSFVNPKAVPGMADAEDVVRGSRRSRASPTPRCGSTRKVLSARSGRIGSPITAPSSWRLRKNSSKRNQNRDAAQQLAGQHAIVEMYKAAGIAVERGSIMAAFGCNFEGDIPVSHVVALVQQILDVAQQHGVTLDYITLADTMAWATPLAVKRVVGALRERWPDLDIALHLHDTRGMAIANAFAGLEMGVTRFDSSVAGLGGCPFAGHARRGRQCLHRRPRLHVQRTRHQDRHRSRRADRMRQACRRCRRPSAARLGDEGRHAAEVSGVISSARPRRYSLRSPKIFQMPLADATMRSPTFSFDSMNRTERVCRTTSQCASTKSPSCTAPMNWMLSSMVACGFSPVARRPVMPMA